MFLRMVRFLSIQLFVLLLATACIDVIAYFTLPNSIAWKFYDYRRNRDYIGTKSGYPKAYYVSHEKRGFDIGANKQGRHEIPELDYSIWSNAIGCFDREWPTVPEKYIYFAGDSFTWGYTPFEQKFATLFEASSGKPSLKCGVSSTSTAHQFDKFKEIAATVGRFPERAIVAYFSNDIADDYGFPQATVMDGWLVNTAYTTSAGDLIRVDADWIRARMMSKPTQPPDRETCTRSLWLTMKCYSATINVLNGLRQVLRLGPPAEAAAPVILDYRGTPIVPLSDLEHSYVKQDRIVYRGRLAQPNQDTIRSWRDHAKANGYTLSFMLIPPPYAFHARGFYAEVRLFLESLGVEVLDLEEEFRRIKANPSQVYWRYDGHFSPSGNRIVAEALVRRWGQ